MVLSKRVRRCISVMGLTCLEEISETKKGLAELLLRVGLLERLKNSAFRLLFKG